MAEDAPFRRAFDAARDPLTARNALGITSTGGGGGAPTDAEYITAVDDPTLTNDRVLTNTATVTWDLTTPGQVKANATATGGVPTARTITAGAGLFGGGDLTTDRIIDVGSGEGIQTGANNVNLDFNGLVEMTLPPDPGDFLCAYHLVATAHRKIKVSTLGFQPLDADLTAIAALTGTNVIYYRSAANTWTAVTIGTGLSFTSGTLASTVTSGAPVGAEYITSTADATLTAERVLTDTATVTWDRTTAGQIKANAVSSGGSGGGPPQGRLTLQSATPVMTTTLPGRVNIYYTPYVGNQVPIYDGTNVVMTTFAELVQTTSDTTKSPAAIGASKCNDWFVWSDAGVLRLSHGPDWTSDTVRSAGTALVMVNGVLLNNASITNGPAASRGTYVGTTRSNASSTLDWKYGTAANPPGEMWFGVWNTYNRVNVAAFCGDTTSNWTSTNVTPHAANAAGSASGLTFRASFIVGLNEDSLLGIYSTHSALSTSSGGTVGIGYDSTSAFSTSGSAQASSTTLQSAITAEIATTPAIGWHFVQALEAATVAGTAAFYGAFQQSMSKLFFSFRM